MILEISVVLLSIWFLTSSYIIWNLTTKQEMLEDWITNFMEIIEKIDFNIVTKHISFLDKLTLPVFPITADYLKLKYNFSLLKHCSLSSS